MVGSLFTALSGLQSHQDWLDVIGNNLANANTPGFKTERAGFSDNFSQTLRFAMGPTGAIGGTNPLQIGGGVALSDIARNFSQGALTATGRTFDLALEGQGFFGLQGPNSMVYTRVGTFGLDGDSNLVDQSSGLLVTDRSGQPIQLDLETLFAPNPTSSIEFTGNLPGQVDGPLAEELTTNTALANGTTAITVGDQAGPFATVPGQTYTMDILVNGGAPQTVSVFSPLAQITATDIVNEINASVTGVTASVNGAGFVEIVSDATGDSASIKVNPGATGFDLSSIAGISTTLATGSQTAADAATPLNDLPVNQADYVPGDGIEIVGVDFDGAPVNATFIYGTDGTTVGELVSFIDSQFAGSTVSLNAEGQITIVSDTPGEANLLLAISDSTGSTGASQWSTHGFAITTDGTGPDEVQASMEVFDQAGTAHTINFTYQRQPDLTWTIIPETTTGQILSNPITGLTFAEDGTPVGLGGLDTEVSVQFDGQTTPQTITLTLGVDGELDGMTQFGIPSSVFGESQDGYGVGELANLSVDADGSIIGFYTNGQQDTLGEIGVTFFSNAEGLNHLGGNFWQESVNSGARLTTPGGQGAAGRVIGGNLERSNVDTATQFVSLIEAQRGYQANARVISAQDDLLQETVNLI